MQYLLQNLAEIAERRARNTREEALIWDILSRDLKRAFRQSEEKKLNRPTKPKTTSPDENFDLKDHLFVRVKNAQRMMGLSRSSIYIEISEGRLPIKKAGSKTLIAVQDIHDWFDKLTDF